MQPAFIQFFDNPISSALQQATMAQFSVPEFKHGWTHREPRNKPDIPIVQLSWLHGSCSHAARERNKTNEENGFSSDLSTRTS